MWDFDNMSMLHRFKLHKVLIQDLSFSADEQFLASLGGQDDNQLVIWDVSVAIQNPLLARNVFIINNCNGCDTNQWLI